MDRGPAGKDTVLHVAPTLAALRHLQCPFKPLLDLHHLWLPWATLVPERLEQVPCANTALFGTLDSLGNATLEILIKDIALSVSTAFREKCTEHTLPTT